MSAGSGRASNSSPRLAALEAQKMGNKLVKDVIHECLNKATG